MIYPKNYIVWDLETSGLVPGVDVILEVAVAIIQEGEVVDTWSSLLNWGVDISPSATAVHGITREMCDKEGADPVDVLSKLLQNIQDAEAHVTHNGTRFDLGFIEAFGTSIDLAYNHIDTAALYKALKLGEGRSWNESQHDFSKRILSKMVKGLKYNVSICCDELGIDREGIVQHRAMADVLLTNEIYKKLTCE